MACSNTLVTTLCLVDGLRGSQKIPSTGRYVETWETTHNCWGTVPGVTTRESTQALLK